MGSFISIGGRQDNIKRKLEGGGFTAFKEIVEEFVSENFYDVLGEIIPKTADKEKYDKAIKKLWGDLR